MLIKLNQFLTDLDQCLTNCYTLKPEAIAWIGTGMEIDNPLNSAEILSPKKKAAR